MKKFLPIALVAAMAVTMLSIAATSIGVLPKAGSPIINTSSGTVTNQILSTTNTVAWPTCILSGQSVTNVTAFSVSSGTHLVIEMDNQITTAAAAGTTNIIYQIGRNVSGGSPTNALGTGLKIEWFATITNILPASAAANTTYTKCICFGPQTGYTDGPFEGGCTTFYVGWITAPANLTVTNSQVYVNSQ